MKHAPNGREECDSQGVGTQGPMKKRASASGQAPSAIGTEEFTKKQCGQQREEWVQMFQRKVKNVMVCISSQ